jgi:hypothetical protein
MAFFEELIGGGVTAVFGNPVFAGVTILLFFIGIAVMAKVNFEASLIFIVPAFILAFNFIPGLRLIIGIIFGIIIGLMFIKIYGAR